MFGKLVDFGSWKKVMLDFRHQKDHLESRHIRYFNPYI